MNFTKQDWFQIISGINNGLITGAALLTTLFGDAVTVKIVAVLGVIGIIINSIGKVFSGQASLEKDVLSNPESQSAIIKNVLAMPGVEKIDVNAKANQSLAAIAVDPAQDKIGPTPAAMATVTQTAKAAA